MSISSATASEWSWKLPRIGEFMPGAGADKSHAGAPVRRGQIPAETLEDLTNVWTKLGVGLGFVALTTVFTRRGATQVVRLAAKAARYIKPQGAFRIAKAEPPPVQVAKPTVHECRVAAHKASKRTIEVENPHANQPVNVKAILDRSKKEILPDSFKVDTSTERGQAIARVIRYNQNRLKLERAVATNQVQQRTHMRQFVKNWEKSGYIFTALIGGALEMFMSRQKPDTAHQQLHLFESVKELQNHAEKSRTEFKRHSQEVTQEIAKVFDEVNELIGVLPHGEQETWRALTNELHTHIQAAQKKDEHLMHGLFEELMKAKGELRHSKLLAGAHEFATNSAACLLGIGLTLFLGQHTGTKNFRSKLVRLGIPAVIVNQVIFTSVASMTAAATQGLLSQKISKEEADKSAHKIAELVGVTTKPPPVDVRHKPIVQAMSSMICEITAKCTAAFCKPAYAGLVEVTSKTALEEAAARSVVKDFTTKDLENIFRDKTHTTKKEISVTAEQQQKKLLWRKELAGSWKGEVKQQLESLRRSPEAAKEQSEAKTLILISRGGEYLKKLMAL